MLIYIPDAPPPWGKFGLLTTLSTPRWRKSRHVLIDIGLRAALASTDVADKLLEFTKKVLRSVKPEVAVVVIPDVACNAEKTYRNFAAYADKFRNLGVKTLYVAHQFWLKRGEELSQAADADIIGIPMRIQCETHCAKRPEICAARFLEYAKRENRELHLLGPAKRTLVEIRNMGALHKVRSFDTAAYRRAPNSRAKNMLNGKWQGTKDVLHIWLAEWLCPAIEQACLYTST